MLGSGVLRLNLGFLFSNQSLTKKRFLFIPVWATSWSDVSLIDWLADRIADWQSDWPTGWPTHWPLTETTVWFMDELIGHCLLVCCYLAGQKFSTFCSRWTNRCRLIKHLNNKQRWALKRVEELGRGGRRDGTGEREGVGNAWEHCENEKHPRVSGGWPQTQFPK